MEFPQMKHSFLVLSLLIFLTSLIFAHNSIKKNADIIIYGGTSAAVVAAVQAADMGYSAMIVCPDKHLGGLSSSGLGWTDAGNTQAIGGLARDFYHRIYLHYQDTTAWLWQNRKDYENIGQGTPAIKDDDQTMWVFEPHVAEKVFEELIIERNIQVFRNEWLNRETGVVKYNNSITSIAMLSGNTFTGKIFIDATYEGDLLAAAGVSYHVGRESNETYDEKWNGVQTDVFHHGHWFKTNIDPYVIPGDPSSGLLPKISSQPPGEKGDGDFKLQAYCYRMCLTDYKENRLPFPKPENYDPHQYELLLRVFDSGWREGFRKFDPIPNRKTDTNNHGPFSTDNIGKNYEYPEASYERRKEILKEHEEYQKGLMYFIANDPRIPQDVHDMISQWGLAKDEFIDNGGWPHQIYVREARRMIGEYIMTEHDVLGYRQVTQPVGMGSYTLDSHNVQRYVTKEGYVQNEGDIGVKVPKPYLISYGSIIPTKKECENLLVPVCASCSHIAFGSIRMEPVFMILGQSAATAAVLAIKTNRAVQDLDYELLKQQLLKDFQRF